MVGVRETEESRITPRLRNRNDLIVCYRDKKTKKKFDGKED